MNGAKVNWDRVAIHVEAGVRENLTISEVSQAMREDSAPRPEIRIAINQIVAAQKWDGSNRWGAR